MTNTNATPRSLRRLWPGVAIVIAQWVLFFIVPAVAGGVDLFGLPLAVLGMFAGLFCAVVLVLWWLFFSGVPWGERIAAVVLIAAGIEVTRLLAHESMVGAHMGVSLFILPVPGLCLALVVWAIATSRVSAITRRAALVGAIALACLPWTLMRTAGVMGAGSEYHWRWTPTPEERLLAQARNEPKPLAAQPTAPPDPATSLESTGNTAPVAPAPASPEKATPGRQEPQAAHAPAASHDAPRHAMGAVPAEWPGFRGPARDGVVRGIEINEDWSAAPPTELWRRAVGPGWSSFAVHGDLIYTQEQRGDDELVSCYRLSTGQPVWRHADRVRFWESNGGAGPRATPALQNGRVYAFGATGILNALDAQTGKTLWSRNVSSDLDRRVPDWGFASSPLVLHDVVIVAAAGTLAAYDVESGDPRWQGPRYGGSYSSPHRVTLDGVEQVVLLGGPGAISVAPEDGAVLWEHKWDPGAIVQPAVTADGDILVNALVATGGVGTRRLHVTKGPSGWNLEERWTSNGLKPYFNDFVVHKDHAYGFDGNMLAAIDLRDGTRKWKGGRYGSGQMILLADQDLLLVISEDGELAMVRAIPDKFVEVGRFPALNAKTWNHPVLVGGILLVRNGEEMAAFRMSPLPTTER